ncbi:MAG: sigma-54 dependent transcriptional regulator [Geminicoccaceae bacterium]
MSCAVLVVDDERTLARNIQSYLTRHGYQVRCAHDGAGAVAVLAEFAPAVILLDLRLPDIEGIELLASLRRQTPTARVVIMTGYSSLPTAVLAIKAGADDYLAKPVVLSELRVLIDRLRPRDPSRGEAMQPGPGLEAILGTAPAIVELRQRIARLMALERQAGHTAPVVLVTGETGTGKELVARALHVESSRAARPFVELNCTALPENLIEDQLFGHERGAFTDAREQRQGLIEAAEGGTLMLDEIGDLGPSMQAKILKFLEDRKIRRLGSVQERTVDVRIVAATHQPLEQLVREGRFRADLYFRLRVVELAVPPLRKRPEDILPLARAFLAESAARWRRPGLRLSKAADELLLAHDWPGNVRELRNLVEQAAVLVKGELIEPADLALSSIGREAEAAPESGFRLPASGLQIDELERDMLRQALERSSWNVTAAARLLGLSRDTVRYRLQKYGLRPP